ncbi:MAG: energy transducer TonB [Methylococcaceae bacterium]
MFIKIGFPVVKFCFLESSPAPMLRDISRPVVTRRTERPWLALVLVLYAHLAVFAALRPQAPSSPAETIPEPISVSLLSAPQPTPEKPVSPATPIEKVEKPVKKPVKKPIAKPVMPRLKPTRSTPSVEQTPTPVVETSAPSAEPETKAAPVINSKSVDTQTYQSPSFNAAYLNNPAPSYPALSRRLGEEGRVLLRVQVMEDGSAGSVELQTGSGSSRLDQAALEAVKKWRFVPAKRGEQPVSASVVVPVRFSIEG